MRTRPLCAPPHSAWHASHTPYPAFHGTVCAVYDLCTPWPYTRLPRRTSSAESPHGLTRAKSPSRCATSHGPGADFPAPEAGDVAPWHCPVRVRRRTALHLFSDRRDRLASVRIERRRLGGDCGGGQRRGDRRRAVHGGATTTNRAIVQSAGSAYRLTKKRIEQEFARHGEMLHVLLRYTQALITQMAQTAVCNRHHSVDQQLCRWLLLSLDRLELDPAQHDPGAHCQHAGGAPRRRHRSGRQAAGRRA